MLFLPVEAHRRAFEFVSEWEIVNDVLNSMGIQLTPTDLDMTLEFRYLPLHDLEAVWWIIADRLISHEPLVIGDERAKTHRNFKAQSLLSSDLFYNIIARLRVLRFPSAF